MYQLTDSQEKDVQSWISKLPDSIVKSQIINLFEEVYPTNRMTNEQLEKFLQFQNALPADFQQYPQIFAQWLKKDATTTKEEDKLGIEKKSQADLKGVIADTHSHIKVDKNTGDTGEQKQEILHTLNVEDETLAGTKTVHRNVEDRPTYTETLKEEAAASAKTSDGKPDAQKAEEESIIARNQDVDAGTETDTETRTTSRRRTAAADKTAVNKTTAPKRAASKAAASKSAKTAAPKKAASKASSKSTSKSSSKSAKKR